MNAVKMLTDQHRELETSMKAVLDAEGEQRSAAFAAAADFLISHVTIEEQLFYPAVKAKRTEDILLESLEEHLSLKRLVADLVGMSVNDDRFEAKLHVLKEQAEHHHKEEEEKLFPKVTKILSEAELDALGAEMDAAQKKLLAAKPRERAANETAEAAPLL